MEEVLSPQGPEQQAVLFPAGSIYLPAEIRALTAIKPTLSERSHADVEALQMLIHNAEEAAKVSPMARTYMRSIVKRLEELQLRLKIWISDVDIGSGVLEHKGGQNGPSVGPDLCSVVRAAFSTLEVNLNDIGDNLSTMRGLFLHMKELGSDRLPQTKDLVTDTNECGDAIAAALRNLTDVGISLEELGFARQNREHLADVRSNIEKQAGREREARDQTDREDGDRKEEEDRAGKEEEDMAEKEEGNIARRLEDIENRKTSIERPSSGDVEKGWENPTVAKGPEDQQEYPPTREVMTIILSLCLATFFVSLDRTIIGTAIPKITDEFHSLGDIGWYGSAYMLMTCSFQLFTQRLYTFYSAKKVFLACIIFFEAGSALCGAAPNSPVFILGRALAGLGASGIFNGATVLITLVVPLQKRPVCFCLYGLTHGISSIVSPLIGGALTTNVSWRWCFYINLPIGGFTIITLFLTLKAPPPKHTITFKKQLAQLDIIGISIFILCIVCLLLALQWGGSTYPWSDGRVIALLVLFGVILIAFAAVQAWKKEGIVPLRVIKQRSVAAGLLYTICIGSAMSLMVYYLPLWFQAIKGVTAVKSGIMTIPFVLAVFVGSIFAGACTGGFGYYVPSMFACAIIVPIAMGLFTTFQTDTGHAKWIGYQVLIGLGIGLGIPQSSVAAQTCLQIIDVPTGISLMFLGQELGGAVFVSVGQNILSSRFISGLAAAKIPGLDPGIVVNAGATNIRDIVKPEYLDAVLKAYNHSITTIFHVATGTSCVLIVGALLMEWKNVKAKVQDKNISAGLGQERPGEETSEPNN